MNLENRERERKRERERERERERASIGDIYIYVTNIFRPPSPPPLIYCRQRGLVRR